MKSASLLLAIVVAFAPLPSFAQEQRDPCEAAATEIASATHDYEYGAAGEYFDACAVVIENGPAHPMCQAWLSGGDAWVAAAEAHRHWGFLELVLKDLLRAEDDYQSAAMYRQHGELGCDATIMEAAAVGLKSVHTKLQHLNLTAIARDWTDTPVGLPAR